MGVVSFYVLEQQHRYGLHASIFALDLAPQNFVPPAIRALQNYSQEQEEEGGQDSSATGQMIDE